MTLAQRLLAGISALFFALLLSVEAIYLVNSRAQIEQQLGSSAQEAATALALRLAALPDLRDRVLLETMLNPLFDRGYFREIRVMAPSGQTLARRELPASEDGVPPWFKGLFRLEPPGAQSLVSTGWRELGRVVVASHPNFAYRQLWSAGVQTAFVLLAMYALAVGAAYAFVSTLLRPLRDVERTADAIGHGHFRAIADIPRTRELASVVSALNTMSGRIQAVVERETARAEELRREVYLDPLTGLSNRRGFEQQLRALLASQGDTIACRLIVLEIQGLAAYNARVGFQRGDETLALLARAVAQLGTAHRAIAGRISAASFALAVPDLDGNVPPAVQLQKDVAYLMAEQGLEADLDFHIGMVRAEGALPGFQELLDASDRALERARAKGRGALEIMDYDAADRGDAAAWRERIEQALDADRISLLSQDALGLASRAALHSEILVRLLRADGEPMPAAQFLPMAARHGLIGRLDVQVAEKIFAHLARRDASRPPLAMNVSARTLADARAEDRLTALLRSEPALAARMAFEITEFGALQDLERTQRFADTVRALGARFALDNFGMRHESLKLVHALRPAYIKLSPAYSRELADSADSRFFATALVHATQPLGIGVYAQAVEEESLLPVLAELGLAGYQGFLAGRPAPLA